MMPVMCSPRPQESTTLGTHTWSTESRSRTHRSIKPPSRRSRHIEGSLGEMKDGISLFFDSQYQNRSTSYLSISKILYCALVVRKLVLRRMQFDLPLRSQYHQSSQVIVAAQQISSIVDLCRDNVHRWDVQVLAISYYVVISSSSKHLHAGWRPSCSDPGC